MGQLQYIYNSAAGPRIVIDNINGYTGMTRFEVKFSLQNNPSVNPLYLNFPFYEGSVTLGSSTINFNGLSAAYVQDQIYTIGCGNGTKYINETVSPFTSQQRSDTYHMWFNANAGGRVLMHIYYLKFFDANDNVILDFVPFDDNGTIGLKDINENLFYTNWSGASGTWTAGPIDGYETLQYIYNTATNARFYNNFNITVDNNSEVEMQFRVLNPNDFWDGRLFLIGEAYHDCYAQFQGYNVVRCGFQSFAEKTTTLQDPSAIHTVNVSANGYFVDGVSLGTLSGSASVRGNGFTINETNNMLLEIYYITIKDNGVLTHKYLPCEYDGVIGLVDTVEGAFYAPTTGMFYGQPLPTPSNQVPINKYKLGADNIAKTYEGGTKINKMYVGNDLVYRALPTTITPTTPTNVDYVHTSTSSATANFIDTGVYPTTDTVYRIVYKPNALIDSTLVGFDGGRTPTRCSSDSTDYRYFYHRGLNDVTFDFNTSRFYKTITFDSDGYADVTIGNNYITDNIAQSTTTGTTQSSMATQNVPIYLNVSSDLDFRNLQIWDNGTLLYDGHAAVLNGEYGVYDSVGGAFTTQTYGGNTMSGGNI